MAASVVAYAPLVVRAIADDGFELVRQWVTAEHQGALLQLLMASKELAGVSRTATGESYAARGLHRAIPSLAAALGTAGVESLAEQIVGAPVVLLDATFFDKHVGANWAVPSHQDRVIATAHAGVKGARMRRGAAYSEPGAEFSSTLVALRVHFDRCDERTGALQLIRGSHLWGVVPDGRLRQLTPDQFTTIDAAAGDVLAMRPLTVHRSPSGTAPSQRRVLHAVYGDVNRANELAG